MNTIKTKSRDEFYLTDEEHGFLACNYGGEPVDLMDINILATHANDLRVAAIALSVVQKMEEQGVDRLV